MKKAIALFIFSFLLTNAKAEDGYRLWMRYDKILNIQVLNNYKQQIKAAAIIGTSPTINVAKKELQEGR